MGFYTQGYQSKKKNDTNIDIDPKTMYTYKAYSKNIQHSIANLTELPEFVQCLQTKQPSKSKNVKSEDYIEVMKKRLKDMFMLPLTEDEQLKIKDSKKSTEL